MATAKHQQTHHVKIAEDMWLYDCKIHRCRLGEFKRLEGVTYLDHAGATQYSQSHLDAYFADLAKNIYGNPHSGNHSSQITSDLVDQIRYRILQHFNTTPDSYSVIFTSGCTAALKLVAESFDFSATDDVTGSDTNKGLFLYLTDNHTSVIGMRDQIGSEVLAKPVTSPEFEQILSSGSVSSLPEESGSDNRILFVYPAQSNFNGYRYPLSWVQDLKKIHPNAFILLDAASFVSTSHLDLSRCSPDFIPISFYKMFGFPTGLGALLVRNESAFMLKKNYFGGGTIEVALIDEKFTSYKKNISERFEDGTIPYLDVIALRHGFDALEKIAGPMKDISIHTFKLAHLTFQELMNCSHGNGQPLAKIYHHGNYECSSEQGAIVNFNILRADGSFVGYAEVDKLAQSYNIHLRTGCFCNLGACQQFLGLTNRQLMDNFKAGHVCGDNMDLLNGQPTGSVRISFGYMSTINDALHFLQFIEDCFVENRKHRTFAIHLVANCHGDIAIATGAENCRREVVASVDPKAIESDGTIKQNGCPRLRQRDLSATESNSNGEQSGLLDNPSLDANADSSHCILTRIYLYPVKSCAGFEVTEWPLSDRGLLYDREWMVVSVSGICLSQKRIPHMCLIRPSIDLQKRVLILSRIDMDDTVEISLDENDCSQVVANGQPCQSKVCHDRIQGMDCGNAVGEWLDRALDQVGLRLVRQSRDDARTNRRQERGSDMTSKGSLSLANEGQFLLINRSSVKMLHQHIQERNNASQDYEVVELESLVERFRANLIVDSMEAFIEESWTSVRIGNIEFCSLGHCNRCQMVCIDQRTGEKTKEPLVSLMSFRNRKSHFGVLLRHVLPQDHGNKLKLRAGSAILEG